MRELAGNSTEIHGNESVCMGLGVVWWNRMVKLSANYPEPSHRDVGRQDAGSQASQLHTKKGSTGRQGGKGSWGRRPLMLSEVCQVQGSPDPGNQLVLMVQCYWCHGRRQDKRFPENREEGGREGSRRARTDLRKC